MNQILTTAIKPAIAMIALAGSLVVADAAQAGNFGQPPSNPAAEAHMTTAIRLMEIACDKPINVSQSLARAAVTHLSLAQRFTRNPGAQAELYGAKATLERFIYSPCASPFHPAIQQTRLALNLERSPYVCGNPTYDRGYSVPSPVGPNYRDDRFQRPRPDFNAGRGGSFDRELQGRDREDRDFVQPRGAWNAGSNSLAGRWGQVRFGN